MTLAAIEGSTVGLIVGAVLSSGLVTAMFTAMINRRLHSVTTESVVVKTTLELLAAVRESVREYEIENKNMKAEIASLQKEIARLHAVIGKIQSGAPYNQTPNP